MSEEIYTGGCQCGAVRYRIHGPLGNAGVCHCRMCQKAGGNFGMALVSVPIRQFDWTRGKPAEFRSTPVTVRGFCARCGTPLYMHEQGDSHYEFTIGSLDEPEAAVPDNASGIESRLSWVSALATLPERTTAEDRSAEDLARLKSLQHPDHDTADWPAG